jgi:SAM-dependent methyltransferase
LKEWAKEKIPPRCLEVLKTLLVKILLLTRKDIAYFYGDDFATTPLRNKTWAGNFCELMLKTFDLRSVIDFGCGTGDLLYPFEEKGIEVLGIDASKANRDHCKINEGNFFLFDIRNAYKAKKKYDLCLCLEVAEHIEEKYSGVLITSLAQSSSTIVFTAAPPGQEGLNHVNLKTHDWWIRKFEGVGFNFDRPLTEQLKQEMTKIPGIRDWYIKNLLVFRSGVR